MDKVICPVCEGHVRRWFTYAECKRDCRHYGHYEDCTYCEDGYVEAEVPEGRTSQVND